MNTYPNIGYNMIHEIIQNAKNKQITEREVKFYKHQHKISQWITNCILRSLKYKDYLYKIHKMVSHTQ